MKKTLSALVLTAILVGLLAVTPVASATGTTYAFRMQGPNVATATVFDEHHQPGDTIRLTGSGTFDVVSGTVTGGGSFVHLKADGTVHMRGTWQATQALTFTAFGGPRNGLQGGVLTLATVHLHADGTPGEAEIPMTMTSAVSAPVGTVGGTTTGPFGQVVSGVVAFAKV